MKRKCTLSNGKQTIEFETMTEAAVFLGFTSHGFPSWYLKRGYARGWKIDVSELEPCYNDITGMKFGKLTALYAEEIKGEGRYQWVCKCDCGNLTKATSTELKRGVRFSCGCSRTKHGMSESRLYHIWKGMKQRCTDEAVSYYKNYGGRGITICEEWLNFEPFMEWSLSHGYSKELTLDRIDNDKGYCPENCRFVDYHTQCTNKRTNHYLTFNGETHTVTEWEDIKGLCRGTISKRIANGMNSDDAICTGKMDLRKALIAINPKTNEKIYFESTKEAERKGFDRAAIWRVIKGEYKHHHGLTWKYANAE